MKKEIRQKIHFKYGGKCAYCGNDITYKEMQVDHLTPIKLKHMYYGNDASKRFYGVVGDNINSFENLMPSCRRCNHYKRSYKLEEYRKLMKSLHERIGMKYINKVAIDYGVIILQPFDGLFYFEKEKEKNDY
jgi:5-methylcytosine-specific restriction endonuclease McrA